MFIRLGIDIMSLKGHRTGDPYYRRCHLATIAKWPSLSKQHKVKADELMANILQRENTPLPLFRKTLIK
jgi:hypothetical protein